MRYSRQREQIFSCVMKSMDHPTAAMVYQILKDDIPRLSLGTVYRNLNQLSELGKLKKISMPDGSDRFDGNLETHSHIVCTGCGSVADVSPWRAEELSEKVKEETSFRLDSYELVMHGTCKKCLDKQKHEFEEDTNYGTQGLKN